MKGKTAPTVSQILSLGVEKEQNLIFSILTRATFGGMKGDVVMLRKYAQVWFERFSGISKPPDHNENKFGWISYLEENCYNFNKTTTTRYSYKAISPLSFDDIPLSAIDFHCSNIVSLNSKKQEKKRNEKKGKEKKKKKTGKEKKIKERS